MAGSWCSEAAYWQAVPVVVCVGNALTCPCSCFTLQPQLTASSLLQLGQPKFRVTYLGGSGTAQGQALDTSTATTTTSSSQGGCSPGDAAWQEAVAAGVAFRRVALAASGCPLPPEALAATAGGGAQGPPSSSGSGAKHGPWCPFFAPVLANRRITAESHFQDTRHLELGLAGSGLAYEPGGWATVTACSCCCFLHEHVLVLCADGEHSHAKEGLDAEPGSQVLHGCSNQV